MTDSDAENLRMQLQQSYESLRALASLAIQGCGILIAADSALLGYGLSQRQAGFVLIAGLMPVLIGLIVRLTLTHGAPLVQVAVRAEAALLPDASTLCTTYLRRRAPQVLRALTGTDGDPEIGPWELIAVSRTGLVALALATLAQLTLGVVGLTVFDYHLL